MDAGSNAIRLVIAAIEDGMPKPILRHREPVRLGHDAFTLGRFTDRTLNEAVAAFHQFRRLLDQHHADRVRAVATSATREARNGAELASRILEETGIRLECISGEEEARLVHLSISRRVDLSDRRALLMDIGGGSMEVTLTDDGEVTFSQSFKTGTVRLLEMLGGGRNFNRLLEEYVDATRRKFAEEMQECRADICVGTGGNPGAIVELARRTLNTPEADRIRRKDLARLIQRLEGMSFEQRIHELGLRPDRADVILPAAMMIHAMMELTRCKTLIAPNASLADGMLMDILENAEGATRSRNQHLRATARRLMRKYHVDARHAEQVCRLSLTLFDQLAPVHGMDKRERLILEIASLTHEIGMFVRMSGHHRHAAYLLSAAPLPGLDADERAAVAQVVRYQRKAAPCQEHEGFASLDKAWRGRVWKLSALLRLAIALDKERRGRVREVRARHGKHKLILHLDGEGDLLLERWAAMKQRDYFEQALGLRLEVAPTGAGR